MGRIARSRSSCPTMACFGSSCRLCEACWLVSLFALEFRFVVVNAVVLVGVWGWGWEQRGECVNLCVPK